MYRGTGVIYLLFLAIFMVIELVNADHCPSKCICGSITSCRKQMNSTELKDLAKHIPADVEELYIEKQEFKTFNICYLKRLEKLRALYLAFNKLEHVPQNISDCLPNLQRISMHGNNITYLKPSDLISYSKIQTLRLSKNKLEELLPNTFQKMSQLTHLLLGLNSISVLHQSAFLGLSALTELDLQMNQIEVIPRNVFSNLKKLESLDLKENNIKHIANDAFNGTTIYHLNLRLNQLVNISNGAFNNSKFKQLNLIENKLNCNCETLAAVYNVSMNLYGMCTTPEQVKMTDIMSVMEMAVDACNKTINCTHYFKSISNKPCTIQKKAKFEPILNKTVILTISCTASVTLIIMVSLLICYCKKRSSGNVVLTTDKDAELALRMNDLIASDQHDEHVFKLDPHESDNEILESSQIKENSSRKLSMVKLKFLRESVSSSNNLKKKCERLPSLTEAGKIQTRPIFTVDETNVPENTNGNMEGSYSNNDFHHDENENTNDAMENRNASGNGAKRRKTGNISPVFQDTDQMKCQNIFDSDCSDRDSGINIECEKKQSVVDDGDIDL